MKLKTQPTIFTILQRDKSANAELLNVLRTERDNLIAKEGYNAWKDRLDRAETEQKVIKKLLQQPHNSDITITGKKKTNDRTVAAEFNASELQRMQTAIRYTLREMHNAIDMAKNKLKVEKVYIFTRQEYFNIKQGLTDLAKTQTKIKRALG